MLEMITDNAHSLILVVLIYVVAIRGTEFTQVNDSMFIVPELK